MRYFIIALALIAVSTTAQAWPSFHYGTYLKCLNANAGNFNYYWADIDAMCQMKAIY